MPCKTICHNYSQGSKVIPQRKKSQTSMYFHVYKKIIIVKIIVYIFITFTSFKSWTICVIYILILIGFSLCKLERQRIKFCVRYFGQFLSNVNADVNGNLPFYKFHLNLNCCICVDRYPIFISHIFWACIIYLSNHYRTSVFSLRCCTILSVL